MKKRSGIYVAAVYWLIAASPPVYADITVSFDPSSSLVSVGDIFTVSLLADIPFADATVGWGIDAVFDGSIVGHNPMFDVALGTGFIPPPPSPLEDGDKLAAVLPFGFPPPLPIFGPNVLVATMTFEALMVGTTDLIGGITTGDPLEGFVMPGGAFANVIFSPGSITVGSASGVVPAPGAALLALMGLPLVGWFKRRFA